MAVREEIQLFIFFMCEGVAERVSHSASVHFDDTGASSGSALFSS